MDVKRAELKQVIRESKQELLWAIESTHSSAVVNLRSTATGNRKNVESGSPGRKGEERRDGQSEDGRGKPGTTQEFVNRVLALARQGVEALESLKKSSESKSRGNEGQRSGQTVVDYELDSLKAAAKSLVETRLAAYPSLHASLAQINAARIYLKKWVEKTLNDQKVNALCIGEKYDERTWGISSLYSESTAHTDLESSAASDEEGERDWPENLKGCPLILECVAPSMKPTIRLVGLSFYEATGYRIEDRIVGVRFRRFLVRKNDRAAFDHVCVLLFSKIRYAALSKRSSGTAADRQRTQMSGSCENTTLVNSRQDETLSRHTLPRLTLGDDELLDADFQPATNARGQVVERLDAVIVDADSKRVRTRIAFSISPHLHTYIRLEFH